jgi:hypothetical protein
MNPELEAKGSDFRGFPEGPAPVGGWSPARWHRCGRHLRFVTARRNSAQQAQLAGFDLQGEILRVDAALGEAAGDEP